MKTDTHLFYKERILKVLLFIQDNLDADLSLDQLASIACFSPYHFHRIFRGMIGESIKEHIRRLRLERAAIALTQTKQSVTQLAFQSGYETVESFTRAFKKQFEASPSLYKKIRRSEIKQIMDIHDLKLLKGDRKMDVNIIKQDEIKVAFVRHIGPYNQCGKAWDTLCNWAGPKGLMNHNTQFVGLSYDDPDVTAGDKIRYDACITVDHETKAEGEIGYQVIPKGDYAVYLHKGPLEGLSASYVALCGQWAPTSGRKIKHEPSIELYLNDPHQVPPEDILVELRLPLE